MDAATYWKIRAQNSDVIARTAQLEQRVAKARRDLEQQSGIEELRARMRATLVAAGISLEHPLTFDDDRLEIASVPIKGEGDASNRT